jgi:hypothetical protein
LGATTASAQKQWVDAFLQRLSELGWTEGRTVAIEYRWGEGRSERTAEAAAELVQNRVDVNVCFGSKADIAGGFCDVRFTPESGHCNSAAKCPLLTDFVAEVRCKLLWSVIPSP